MEEQQKNIAKQKRTFSPTINLGKPSSIPQFNCVKSINSLIRLDAIRLGKVVAVVIIFRLKVLGAENHSPSK